MFKDSFFFLPRPLSRSLVALIDVGMLEGTRPDAIKTTKNYGTKKANITTEKANI